MKTTESDILKTRGHRLSFAESGLCSCILCNCTGTLEEVGDCPAPDSERTEFDARYSPAKEKTCTVQFEYTDTFGGEANYSWVRRHEATFPADISDLALVCRAKAWAGLSGVRCRVENMGDLIALYPSGSCTVLFVSTVY